MSSVAYNDSFAFRPPFKGLLIPQLEETTIGSVSILSKRIRGDEREYTLYHWVKRVETFHHIVD
jgi:hypothetical protein